VGIIIETLVYNIRIFLVPENRGGMILYVSLNWPSAILVRTGFGIVLYSRLHIIKQDHQLSRGLLAMIIVIAVIGHSGLIIYSAAGYASNYDLLSRIYDLWIYVEVVFTVQDVTLSSLYIFYFWKYLNDVPAHAGERMRKESRTIFALLLIAYIWVILADVSMYTLLCVKLFLARMMCMPFLDAIKLRLEFLVLNRLIEVGNLKQQFLGRQSLASSLIGSGVGSGTTPSAPSGPEEPRAELLDIISRDEGRK
jgi:hypothetical protein